MSYAAGAGMPSRAATWAAVLGLRSIAVQVATTTRSIETASKPLVASGLLGRAGGQVGHASRRAAMWRVRIPTRLRIHSSLVSTSAAQVVVGEHLGRLVMAERDDAGTGHAPTQAGYRRSGSRRTVSGRCCRGRTTADPHVVAWRARNSSGYEGAMLGRPRLGPARTRRPSR